MRTEFTHIRISEDTKRHLNELRAPGQSYDGLLRELISLSYQHMRPTNPILPGDKLKLEPIKSMEPESIKDRTLTPHSLDLLRQLIDKLQKR